MGRSSSGEQRSRGSIGSLGLVAENSHSQCRASRHIPRAQAGSWRRLQQHFVAVAIVCSSYSVIFHPPFRLWSGPRAWSPKTGAGEVSGHSVVDPELELVVRHSAFAAVDDREARHHPFATAEWQSRRMALRGLVPLAGAVIGLVEQQEAASAGVLDAIFGSVPPTTVLQAFNITAPKDWQLKKVTGDSSNALLLWGGEKIQRIEAMTAVASTTTASSIGEVMGGNVTEAAEKLAKKFEKEGRNPTVREAIAQDPSGQGLDVYTMDIQTDTWRELALYTVLRRGSDNILCYVGLRTPTNIYEFREDSFKSTLASFTPLEAQPTKAREDNPEGSSDDGGWFGLPALR